MRTVPPVICCLYVAACNALLLLLTSLRRFFKVCRRRLKRVLATSKVRGQAGVELVAQLPQRVAAWILDTPESDGSGAEGEIGLQPVKATCSLMRLAAELLRTAEGGGDANPDSDAVMAMTCVEAIQ